MRGSEWGRDYNLDDVLEAADSAAGNLPQTDDVHAFLDLLEAAAWLER